MSTRVANEDGPRWRGTTEAERVAPRRRRLIDAAYELLGDTGTVTVRGVCAHARLNPRYFYESFEDLDELVAAVFDQVMDETEQAAVAAIAAAPNTAEAKVRAAIESTIRYVAEDPRRTRIVFDAGGSNEALARRQAAAVARTARNMAEHAAQFNAMPRDDRLLRSATVLLAGGTAALVASWHAGLLDLTLDELVDHCSTLVLAGLVRATSAVRSGRA